MYHRILVSTDGSPCSDEAVAHGIAIAQAMESTMVFLHVMDTLSARHEGIVNMTEAREALTVQGQTILDRAQHMAIAAGVRSSGELVEGTPADVIVRRSTDFDLVVMSSHGKGILKRVTVGSATQAVLHGIMRPLLVIRCDPDGRARDSQ
jgi:nucleotide-binding universal stress UspA family protein